MGIIDGVAGEDDVGDEITCVEDGNEVVGNAGSAFALTLGSAGEMLATGAERLGARVIGAVTGAGAAGVEMGSTL